MYLLQAHFNENKGTLEHEKTIMAAFFNKRLLVTAYKKRQWYSCAGSLALP